MGAGASAEQVCRATRLKYLVAHGVNNHNDIADALTDGANGIELDLQSDGTTWFVNHDAPRGESLSAYMDAVSAAHHAHLRLIYLDIKTPTARNLEDLNRYMDYIPGVLVLYGTAKDAPALLRLHPDATLAVDIAWRLSVAEITQMFAGRRYFIGDGNMPMLPKPSMATTMREIAAYKNAKGSFAWTYSQLNAWSADVTTYPLTMTTVNPTLVRPAAEILCKCVCGPDCAGMDCRKPDHVDWRT